MNDRQLRTFLAVAETRSFSKAEARLFMSRQAIKKQIDTLEEELGFDLLVRNVRGVKPTPAGEQYYKHVRQLIEDYDRAVNDLRAETHSENSINIGNPNQPRLILEAAFEAFTKAHPSIHQNIVYLEDATSVDSVLTDTVDVVECVPPADLDTSRLGRLKLTELHYHCLLSPQHPLASRKRITMGDLKGATIGIRLGGNSGIIHELREKCEGITLYETHGSEMNHIFRICFNQGVFISRAFYSEDIPPFVSVPLDTEQTVELDLIYKKNCKPAVTKFLSIAKKIYPL